MIQREGLREESYIRSASSPGNGGREVLLWERGVKQVIYFKAGNLMI